jgi:hypothetical protein
MEFPSSFWLASAAVFVVLAGLNVAIAGNTALTAGFVLVAVVHAGRGIWDYTR